MNKVTSIFITLLFILPSCSKWFKVKTGNGQIYIEDFHTHLIEAKVDEWKVGKNREKVISKGFRFKIKIPKIHKDDAKKLYQKGGVDSYIFRISKKERRGYQPVGHILYNIQNFSKVSDSITGHIYFHAAVSGEFRKQKCPAFNHRKRITDLELVKTTTLPKDLFIKRMKSYRTATIDTPSFSPVIFSGGRSLLADFKIELALMNSKEKILYSKWLKIGNFIRVESEAEVSIPSCAGVKSENNF